MGRLKDALHRFLVEGSPRDRSVLDDISWDYIEYQGQVVGMMLVESNGVVLEMRGCTSFIDKIKEELKLRKTPKEKHQYELPVGKGLLGAIPVVVDDFSFPFKSPEGDPCPLTVIQGGAGDSN